jgi:type I restriction enzyme M protein
VKAYSKTKPIRGEEFEPIKKWWKKRTESEICWKVSLDTIIERGYDLDVKNPNKDEEVHEYSTNELIQMMDKSFGKSSDLLKQLKQAVQ